MIEKKPCSHCGKNINKQYRVCPLCGGHQINLVEIKIPQCPRCAKNLDINMVDSETYDICPSCGGMWLDRDEFHRATREAEVYGRIGKEISKQEYLLAPANDNCGYIPCVRCGKLMNRKNFARISGVIIDECSVHGVWLDAGELNKMQHFIADGGLERSQDREIEKTKNELRELAIQVDQTAFSNKLIHFWNFKRWLFGG